MPEFREICNWIERLVQRCVMLLQNRLNNGNPNNLNNGLHQVYAPKSDGHIPIQPVISVVAVAQVPIQAAVQAPVQPVADIPFPQVSQVEDMEVDQAPIQQVAAAAQENKVTSRKRHHGKQTSEDVIVPKKWRYDQFE